MNERTKVTVVVRNGVVREVYSSEAIDLEILEMDTLDKSERGEMEYEYEQTCMRVLDNVVMRVY